MIDARSATIIVLWLFHSCLSHSDDVITLSNAYQWGAVNLFRVARQKNYLVKYDGDGHRKTLGEEKNVIFLAH